MLKTLGRTTWFNIKVGEVFACDGCWQIYLKTSDSTAKMLADDYLNNWFWKELFYPGLEISRLNKVYDDCSLNNNDLYKLPLKTQRLWRED